MFKRFLFLGLFFFMLSPLMAQKDYKAYWSGTIQSWYTAAQSDSGDYNNGFGLRRVRLRYHVEWQDKLFLFIQTEWTTPQLYDARLTYYFNPDFSVRLGRFVGAGVRSGAMTLHRDIDILERPQTSIEWGKRTVGSDYRDFGIQFQKKFGVLKARLYLHNGDGSMSVINRAGDKNRRENNNYAVDGMIILSPDDSGLEAGIHLGTAEVYNESRSTYSLYYYHTFEKLRIKTELITLVKENNQNLFGYYGFAGYKISPNTEVMFRAESLDPMWNEKYSFDYEVLHLTAATAFYKNLGDLRTKTVLAVVYPHEKDNQIDNAVFQAGLQVAF